MCKKNLILTIFGLLSVVGIIILMNSIDLGENKASDIMMAQGGSMDTNTYLIYLEQYITNYRVVGSILSILGGLGILKNTDIKS